MFLILLIFAYRPIQITTRSEQKRPVKNRSAPSGRDRNYMYSEKDMKERDFYILLSLDLFRL